MSQTVSPPMSLYKYLPAKRAREFFEKPVLRFTPPSELNDIFELKPPVRDASFEQDEDGWDWLAKINGGDFEPSMPLDKWVNFFDNESLDRDESEYLEYLKMLRDLHTMQQQRGAAGILSLSSINDSLLMWSHYCVNHAGFVIELDAATQLIKPEPDGRIFGKPKKITYTEERPSIPIANISRQLKKSKQWSLYFLPLYFTKSKDWSYEEEWRVVTREVDNLNTIIDDKGREIKGFTLLPVKAIKSVILGFRADSDLWEQARTFSREHNIILKQAMPDRLRFALNIIEVK